jgi:hypothetical protein
LAAEESAWQARLLLLVRDGWASGDASIWVALAPRPFFALFEIETLEKFGIGIRRMGAAGLGPFGGDNIACTMTRFITIPLRRGYRSDDESRWPPRRLAAAFYC